MAENRRKMHNHCENRRRNAIHQGLTELRELLDEDGSKGSRLPDGEAVKRLQLSRPETLLRAVCKIERLKTTVRQLEKQQRLLTAETQRLRRIGNMNEAMDQSLDYHAWYPSSSTTTTSITTPKQDPPSNPKFSQH